MEHIELYADWEDIEDQDLEQFPEVREAIDRICENMVRDIEKAYKEHLKDDN